MEVDLLDFVEQCRQLAKQALGSTRASPPAATTRDSTTGIAGLTLDGGMLSLKINTSDRPKVDLFEAYRRV